MTDGPAHPAALTGIVDRFSSRHLAVVGDVMLDHFVYGRVNRISPEAPVPVVEFQRETFRLGGAANVAQNLRAYGAEAILIGVVGEDDGATRVLAAMNDLGLSTHGIVRTPHRPTTRKMRIVTTRNQQVARVDFEQDADLEAAVEAQVVDCVLRAMPHVDAIVVSDYLKGVVTRRLMSDIVAAARERGVPLLVDPKIPHIDHYHGATLVTPNHHEAETATAMRIRTDEDARTAARLFRTRAVCTSVLITRGEQGMWLLDGDTGRPPGHEREHALGAVAREVADVTGAGDTVIATIALSLATGADLSASAMLASHAAGISVSKFGPATVSPEELTKALQTDVTTETRLSAAGKQRQAGFSL